MTASVWQPGSGAIAVNAENASLIQKFIATAGQTTFTLTQFTYVIGTGSIRVYRNGVKLAVSEVTELSTTSFSLTIANLLVGEVIECSAVLGSQEAVTAAAISAAASAATAVAAAATVDAANIVHITGTETITGTKTFKSGTLMLRNLADTVSSLFYNVATGVRSWTFPDKDGTVVVTSNGAVNTADITAGSITQATLAANVAGNGPAFRARLLTNPSLGINLYTKIICASAIFDTAGAYSTVTGRFTPPVAGYYQINATIGIAGTGTLSEAIGALYVNGLEVTWAEAAINGLRGSVQLSSVIYLNGTTDYVEIFGYGTATTVAAMGARTEFSGCLVRTA